MLGSCIPSEATYASLSTLGAARKTSSVLATRIYFRYRSGLEQRHFRARFFGDEADEAQSCLRLLKKPKAADQEKRPGSWEDAANLGEAAYLEKGGKPKPAPSQA